MMKKRSHQQLGKGEKYMATVTNWIDHLSAEEVVGAVLSGSWI